MRTAAHFDGGGDRSTGLAKLSAFNGNGFGANSSRGEAQNPLPAAPSASGAHGGLTAAQLAAHDQAANATGDLTAGESWVRTAAERQFVWRTHKVWHLWKEPPFV